MGDMDGGDGSFMHYHYYAFPLLVMLDLFIKQTCNADGYMDLDIMYMSELDPTRNNDELAFYQSRGGGSSKPNCGGCVYC